MKFEFYILEYNTQKGINNNPSPFVYIVYNAEGRIESLLFRSIPARNEMILLCLPVLYWEWNVYFKIPYMFLRKVYGSIPLA